MIATTTSSILAVAVVARFILPVLTSRWTWAALTIGTSLTMVGGFMFVRIRGMPYVAAGQNGAQLIAPGFQSQYGIEVQIIAFLCASSCRYSYGRWLIFSFLDGVLSLGFISLTLVVPRHPSPARQRYGVYLWTGVMITLFSALVSIFKMKNGGMLLLLMSCCVNSQGF